MKITQEELIEGIRALNPEEKVELLNGIRAYLQSLVVDASSVIDSFIYGMTRVYTYNEVARVLGVSAGMVNASVTRTKARNDIVLNEAPVVDPFICTRCGLPVGGHVRPAALSGLRTHNECSDRRGHKMTMRVTSTWNKVMAFCECDWNPQSVFQSWMMARRAHYTYVQAKASMANVTTEGI